MQEEIKKHTQKVYKAYKSNHSFAEKLKEIGIEIGIIVFAVSLSIWMHSWSENRHQQDEANEFLVDLKSDLTADILMMKNVQQGNSKKLKEIEFLSSLTVQKMDSLKKADKSVNFNANINISKFNVGNYEGFKSSGKIAYIENKKLKKLILEYYQGHLPSINEFDVLNKELALKLFEDVFNNADKTGKELFLDKKFKGKINFYVQYSKGYLTSYDEVIKQAETILKEIN